MKSNKERIHYLFNADELVDNIVFTNYFNAVTYDIGVLTFVCAPNLYPTVANDLGCTTYFPCTID